MIEWMQIAVVQPTNVILASESEVMEGKNRVYILSLLCSQLSFFLSSGF